MNVLVKWIVSFGLALASSLSFALTDAQVFAYAEANYPSLFSGAATSGQYLQYNYRFYATSRNYLAVDTNGEIFLMGPYTNNAITSVGKASTYATVVAAWEAKQTTPTGVCGDTSSIASFLTSNKGSLNISRSGGNSGSTLYQAYSDSAGYLMKINDNAKLVTITTLANPNALVSLYAAGANFDFQVSSKEVNVIFKASPTQPTIGYTGVLQCEFATGKWTLAIAAAATALNNVTFTVVK